MTSLTRLAVVAGLTSFVALAAASGSAFSPKKYDVGATDTEIKVGNIMPYSGTNSAWSMLGRTEAAYFRKITIKTSPTDFAPIKQVQFRRFNGEKWEPFGPILSGEIGGMTAL